MDSQRSLRAERGELDYLTALRFVAAIGVVFHHVGMNLEGFPPLAAGWITTAREHGSLGVQFFFTLSGFILAYVYSAKETVDWKSFVTARVARVYPVYLFALLVGLPMLAANLAEHVANHGVALGWAVSAVKGVAVLLLVQAWLPSFALFWNGVSWSLSAEAFFYACFPRLLKWAQGLSAGNLGLCLGGLLAFEVLRSFAYGFHPSLAWGFTPALRIHEFLSGVIVCVLHLRGFRAGVGLGIAAATILVLCVFGAHLGDSREILRTLGTHVGFCLLISALAIPRVEGSGTSRRMAPLVFLGQISYATYLLHFPLLVLWEKFLGAAHLRFWWFLGALLLCSCATYVWIEEPARKWIRGRSSTRSN